MKLENIKKVFIEIYDTLIWSVLFISIGLLILYLSLPIITYYFNVIKVNALTNDFSGIGAKNSKFLEKKILDKSINIDDKNNNNENNVQIVNINQNKEMKKVNNGIENITHNKYSNLLRLKNLIKKNKNNNTNVSKKAKDNNIENGLDGTKGIKKDHKNNLEKFPIKDFILNSNKIYINGEYSNIIYKNIKENIQKDLWKNSVISDFYGTPIIFTHSSGGKYNFGLYYLHLKEGGYVYLEGKYNGISYYIEGTVNELYKNIPGNNLYNILVDIWHKQNYNKDKVFYLDTCELNWTLRRIIIVKINKIYIK